MINLKACNRCGGDMMAEELLGDVELVCLQCGHRQPIAQATPTYRARVTTRMQPEVRKQQVAHKRAA